MIPCAIIKDILNDCVLSYGNLRILSLIEG